MRYALYFLPGPGHLRELATSWLGHDIVSGRTVTRSQTMLDLVPDLDELTAVPRRYGLHATLKAPFRLAMGSTEAQLIEALADSCRILPPVILPGLALTEMDSFLCLAPRGDSDEPARLADFLVRNFDRFRAPLEEKDRQRRMVKGLTARERLHLEQWGYPYVMENFRFHISLTGQVANTDSLQELRRLLEVYLAPALRQPLLIDSLALVREPAAGAPFELIERFTFTGESSSS
jgi:putative phosphonate metabolism protein